MQDFADDNVDRRCTLTIDANGGIVSNGKAVHSIVYPYKAYEKLTVDSNDIEHPTRKGYKFSG